MDNPNVDQMFERSGFDQLLARLDLKPVADVYGRLVAAHDEPWRFYHNRSHVADCLRVLTEHRTLAERIDEVALAIWFHDSVYEPRRSDNEERSARWASEFLHDAGATAGMVDRVSTLIMATKTHVAATGDAELLMDIDLSILGRRREEFEAYDTGIRKEYAWVPENQYREGRQAVLQTFLDREHLYCTAEFRKELEEAAHRNLVAKIAELSR